MEIITKTKKQYRLEEIKKLKLKSDEYNAYQKSLLSYRDMINVMKTKFEEGIEKGIEKIALRCLKQGKSIKETAEITGLSEKQIELIARK